MHSAATMGTVPPDLTRSVAVLRNLAWETYLLTHPNNDPTACSAILKATCAAKPLALGPPQRNEYRSRIGLNEQLCIGCVVGIVGWVQETSIHKGVRLDTLTLSGGNSKPPLKASTSKSALRLRSRIGSALDWLTIREAASPDGTPQRCGAFIPVKRTITIRPSTDSSTSSTPSASSLRPPSLWARQACERGLRAGRLRHRHLERLGFSGPALTISHQKRAAAELYGIAHPVSALNFVWQTRVRAGLPFETSPFTPPLMLWPTPAGTSGWFWAQNWYFAGTYRRSVYQNDIPLPRSARCRPVAKNHGMVAYRGFSM